MIKPISRYLKLKSSQQEKIQQQYEDISWLYSEDIRKRMLACYLYSLPGQILVTLPIFLLVSYLIS